MDVTPVEYQIWNAQECAEYLRESYQQFIQRTQYRAGFPKRCQIPGRPRWAAIDVIQWAIGHREAA